MRQEPPFAFEPIAMPQESLDYIAAAEAWDRYLQRCIVLALGVPLEIMLKREGSPQASTWSIFRIS